MAGMNVLVYAGRGVSDTSLRLTLSCLRATVGRTHTIRTVDAQTLQADPWEGSCALLVVPGGRDVPYVEDLAGVAVERIARYVAQGGAYLGLCAGAYFASSRILFDVGGDLEVVGDRPLGLVPHVTAVGPAIPGYSYEGHVSAKACPILAAPKSTPLHVYYNGGCYFDMPATETDGIKVLATYAETGKPAIIHARSGSGNVLLSGVHVEYTAEDLQKQEGENLPFPISKLLDDDTDRSQLWSTILVCLGMRTGQAVPANDEPSGLVLYNFQPSQWMDGLCAEKMTFEICIDPSKSLHDTLMPVFPAKTLDPATPDTTFNPSRFYAALKTSVLARQMVYCERIHSTQTLLTQNPAFSDPLVDGTIVLAGDQLAGKGRGSNTWLSSTGCLQFTLIKDLPPSHKCSLSIFQCLVATAMAEAVNTAFGVTVSIKWPNDMYAMHGGVLKKMGGILVNSAQKGVDCRLYIGFGFNVSDTPWSVCLSDLLVEAGKPPVGKEDVLAAFLNTFEFLYTRTMMSGVFPYDLYYTHWLHREEIVWLEEEQCKARIKGIDGDGYLQASPVSDGIYGLIYDTPTTEKTFRLQPDGNSFDLMKKLIKRKT